MKLDYSKIDDIVIEGINGADCPDFCDAFIGQFRLQLRHSDSVWF